MAVYTSIIIIAVIIYLSEKKNNICLFSIWDHNLLCVSRLPKQKRKGKKKSQNSVWVYVRGKSDQGIEVPYGPINNYYYYIIIEENSRMLHIYNIKL